jgi:hypothetical protein
MRGIIKSVTLLVILAAFMVPPLLRPLNYLSDDAYFYLVIAKNIVDGHGSTFNTITPTNGYHPLWLAVCTAMSFVASDSKSAALTIILLVQQLFAIVMLVVFKTIAVNLGLKYSWLAFPVFFAFFLTGMYASEAHINGLCVLLSILFLQKIMLERPLRLSSCVLLGLTLGLTFLARLDNVFLLMCFFSFAVYHIFDIRNDCSLQAKVGGVLALSLSAAAVVAPYVTHNYLTTGHYIPISGAIKTTFPAILPGFSSKLGATGLLTITFALFGLFMAFFVEKEAGRRFLLGLLSFAVVLHGCYVALFTSHTTTWSWYYVAGMLNLAFTLIVAVNVIARQIERADKKKMGNVLQIGISAAVLLVGVYALARTWARFNNPDAVEGTSPTFSMNRPVANERWPNAVGAWLRDNLPGEARVLVYDFPGAISYVSGLSILPADGLVCDFKYNDDIIRQGIAHYLNEERVTFWLGPESTDSIEADGLYKISRIESGYAVKLFAPLYRCSAGCFFVRDTDKIVDFRRVISHPNIPDIALWKIVPSDQYVGEQMK